ncbi:MAG: Y-family DNA polymerase [Methylococcaceae bacterium]
MTWSWLYGAWLPVSHASSEFPRRIALVDCNNFYASCERVFHPAWEGRPLAVLSNNDGCIIARSDELKALKIPMGMPYFQAKPLLKKASAVVVSSNYELYGDMSARVMTLLGQYTPEMEVYSIDEAFLDLTGFAPLCLDEYARGISRYIKQCSGIPVSIGIGPTKVLAKLANRIAKKRKIPGGLFDLGGADALETVLESTEVADIWGVGRRWGQQLNQFNIFNARQLRDADTQFMRKQFSVVMERVILELRGTACLGREDVLSKQQIIASRSFGRRITAKNELGEALALHTCRAAERLRQQGSLAGAIIVTIMTGRYHPEQTCFAPSCCIKLAAPTAHSGQFIQAAQVGLKRIYRSGHSYAKAGVMLLDIVSAASVQQDIFNDGDTSRSTALMQVVDDINQRHGKGTLRYAREGFQQRWAMQRHHKSPGYTTCWRELPSVY